MTAKMNKFSGWCAECDPLRLQEYFDFVLHRCGFRVCGVQYKYFDPYGFTALYLLSESHFAIHTFPEENRTYIELSSCVDKPFEMFLRSQEDAPENYKIKI